METKGAAYHSPLMKIMGTGENVESDIDVFTRTEMKNEKENKLFIGAEYDSCNRIGGKIE